jgi:hypothetical protein
MGWYPHLRWAWAYSCRGSRRAAIRAVLYRVIKNLPGVANNPGGRTQRPGQAPQARDGGRCGNLCGRLACAASLTAASTFFYGTTLAFPQTPAELSQFPVSLIVRASEVVPLGSGTIIFTGSRSTAATMATAAGLRSNDARQTVTLTDVTWTG